MPLTEDSLTQWFRDQRPTNPEKVLIGIGDDMAQVSLADHRSVLITTDMLLEGVHFNLSNATWEQVGYKSMGASLSDCAAMACRPTGAVISLGLPPTLDPDHLYRLYHGFLQAADRFDCPIVGGDLTRGSQGLVINVALLGVPMKTKPVQRSGARPGDILLVTGTLGGSLAGHHLDFYPRLAEARRLTELVDIHAMIDLSDGLSRDLPRLCRASGIGARVRCTALPLSPAALAQTNPVQAALNDGEDFELLLAIGPDAAQTLKERWDLDTPLHPIGHCTGELDISLQNEQGQWEDLSPAGFDHFSRDHHYDL